MKKLEIIVHFIVFNNFQRMLFSLVIVLNNKANGQANQHQVIYNIKDTQVNSFMKCRVLVGTFFEKYIADLTVIAWIYK